MSAFLLAFLVGALAWGGPAVIFAVPIVVIGIGIALFADFKKRGKGSEPLQDTVDRSREDEVHFTERDRQTLYSD